MNLIKKEIKCIKFCGTQLKKSGEMIEMESYAEEQESQINHLLSLKTLENKAGREVAQSGG